MKNGMMKLMFWREIRSILNEKRSLYKEYIQVASGRFVNEKTKHVDHVVKIESTHYYAHNYILYVYICLMHNSFIFPWNHLFYQFDIFFCEIKC